MTAYTVPCVYVNEHYIFVLNIKSFMRWSSTFVINHVTWVLRPQPNSRVLWQCSTVHNHDVTLELPCLTIYHCWSAQWIRQICWFDSIKLLYASFFYIVGFHNTPSPAKTFSEKQHSQFPTKMLHYTNSSVSSSVCVTIQVQIETCKKKKNMFKVTKRMYLTSCITLAYSRQGYQAEHE